MSNIPADVQALADSVPPLDLYRQLVAVISVTLGTHASEESQKRIFLGYIISGLGLPEGAHPPLKRNAQIARAYFLRLPVSTQEDIRSLLSPFLPSPATGGKRRTSRKARKTRRRRAH